MRLSLLKTVIYIPPLAVRYADFESTFCFSALSQAPRTTRTALPTSLSTGSTG